MHPTRKAVIRFISLVFVILGMNQGAFSQGVKYFSSKPDEFLKNVYDMFAEIDEVMAEGYAAEFKSVFPLEGMELKKRLKVYKAGTEALEDRYKKLKIEATYQYADTTPKFSNYQIDAIVKTCNEMLVKRLKPIPHFVAYFNSLLSFINTNQSELSFEAWNTALNKLLGENTRYFTTFIDNCNDIFLYRSVFVSRNVRWIRTVDQFTFDYDSLPKVVFPKMDLYCLAKDDTAFIYGTEGSYYLTKGIWVGKGGKVLWTRAGINPDVSWAELSDYKIEMQSSFYEADSVTYYNYKYFKNPVQGHLEEKLLANTRAENASFPQFYSYSGRVKIEELEKNVDYEGGFMIKGPKLVGKEADGVRAKVIFKREGLPFLVAEANSFTMNEERIGTKAAKIVVYLEDDSIFHPSIDMKFLIEKRELSLLRQEQGLGGAPYYNTFHKVDMYIDWIKWNIDEAQMEFTTMVGSSNDEMKLESANYYSPERFNMLQGLQEVHPLYIIREYIEKQNEGDRRVTDEGLAGAFRMDLNSIQRLMIKFANQGFVMYDINGGIVTVQQRLFDYLNAKSEKADYDNITIVSHMKGKPNAIFNLNTYNFEIDGVWGVVLSENRKTGYLPKGKHLVLHKGRDMTFDGVLRSGNYEFHGSGFSFNYDQFTIDMPMVDSARLKAMDVRIEKEEDGSSPYTMVNSVIETVNGELMIDPPHNKSGILTAEYPEFPKFISKENSYVRYNKRNNRGPVYDPQRVYYKLDPFEVDSLTAYTNEGLKFTGVFVSGGIFPDIHEPLVLMKDHSLGFVHSAGYEGKPVYGGKATFKNDIKLSNQGIMGDGEFDYITSVTKSDAFIFYLDSMNAYAQNFTLGEKTGNVEYPDVVARNVKVHYEPIEDFMLINNTTFPMTMYNFEARLNGGLRYDHNAMTGHGVLDFDNAELSSDLFDFKNRKFAADTSDFKLKADDIQGIAFATNNVHAEVDLEKRMGEFTANDGASYVDFPVNKYICFMDQFKWLMDNFELELSSGEDATKSGNTGAADEDLDLSGSEFISTHPDQDSLKFVSPKANYDLKNYVIKAHQVKYVNVADARVYTSDGEVVVERDADMQALKKAEIVANIVTKYHTISNATVDIKARRNYTAEGDYKFVDAEGNEQPVHFDNVRVDGGFQTIASGIIGEDAGFKLNPYFEFKGQASIEANKIGMYFTGGTRLKHECDYMKPWLSFAADIDPADVMIPIDENIKGYDIKTKMEAGLYYNRDTEKMYNIFLAPKKFHSDAAITTATGFLKYNFDEEEFQISSKEKLNSYGFPGNFVALNTKTCDLRGEGKLVLEGDLGQVKLLTAGEVTSTIATNVQEVNSTIAFDFLLNDGMWKIMAENLQEIDLDPVNISESYYEKAILEIAGKEEGDKLISELNLFGKFKKVPDVFVHDLILSDVKMKWNKKTNSFISKGMIGVGMVGETQISKYVDGYVEIIRGKKKEELNIYLELTPGVWFFFQYSSGIMKTISSLSSYNAIIGSIKEDERSSKGTKATGPYVFIQGSELQLKKFLARMEDADKVEETPIEGEGTEGTVPSGDDAPDQGNGTDEEGKAAEGADIPKE